MDNEKKYKEALEKAKEFYNSPRTCIDIEALTEIFPEPKESEDERIRKELIEFLREAYSRGNAPEECAKWLVWLDWPKEQKEPIDPFDTKLFQDGVKEGRRLEREDIKKEQKPAEWSEEDKVMLNNIIWGVHLKSINPLDEMDDRSKYKKYEDFLKSLPERFALQPKQEWSEEDITNGWTGVDLERYFSCLQRLGTGNPQHPETINSKWFKEHFRPQPHWKPREEQMKALSDCVIGNEYDVHVLARLWAELKKL